MGARAEYERVFQLNPNDATAHHWFALDTLANTGQNERELAEMKRALELDPLSMIINSNLAQAYIYAGRFDEAIAQLRKTRLLERTTNRSATVVASSTNTNCLLLWSQHEMIQASNAFLYVE